MAAEPLKDSDPFPFGKYKGVPMRDVPASYFDWLRDWEGLPNFPRVEAYMDRNKAIIDGELEADE